MDRTTDTPVKRFAAALIGLFLGQFVGSNATTLARLILFIKDGTSYQVRYVNELSLILVFAFAMLSAAFAAYAARRGWEEYPNIVLSAFSAILVAAFFILELSIPKPPFDRGPDDAIALFRLSYFLLWALFLIPVPVLLQPARKRGFGAHMMAAGTMLGALGCAAVFGFALSHVLRGLVAFVFPHFGPIADFLGKTRPYALENFHFWIVNPAAIAPIGCAFVVVAFAPYWQQSTWRDENRSSKHVWIAFFSAVGVLLAGLYGIVLYVADHDWAKTLLTANQPVLAFRFFLAFASFPIALIAAILGGAVLGSHLFRKHVNDHQFGRHFWLIVAGLLFLGFALATLLTINPLLHKCDATVRQTLFLALLQGLNGALIATALFATSVLARRYLSEEFKTSADEIHSNDDGSDTE